MDKVDWEGLKAFYSNRTGVWMGDEDWQKAINNAFPAILAEHERDQRVIVDWYRIAKHLRNELAYAKPDTEYPVADNAIAEFDKAINEQT